MSEPDEYLATLYVENHRGDRVWVTERVCQDRHSGTRWIETELNARRQEVTLGTQEDWRYESRVVPPAQHDPQIVTETDTTTHTLTTPPARMLRRRPAP
jgi:hypothetical protein